MKSICGYCRGEFTQKRPHAPKRFCSCKCSALSRDNKANRGIFPKGIKPWNAGVNNWRPGYSHSQDTRKKISAANRGPASALWRGGISPENERQRKTAAYKAWRTAVFSRDGYACVHCGDKTGPGHKVVLNADHILPFAKYPEKRLDVENGRTLCETCHRQTETYGAACQKEVSSGR